DPLPGRAGLAAARARPGPTGCRWTERYPRLACGRRGWLDERGGLGAIPGGHIRHAFLCRVLLGTQHVQSRGGRGTDGADGLGVLPRRSGPMDRASRFAEIRFRSVVGRGAGVGDVLRHGGPGRDFSTVWRDTYSRGRLRWPQGGGRLWE